MSKIINDIKFFKQRNIKQNELVELVSAFKFEEFEAGEDVINHGESGDKFYIILKGKVKVMIPNPKVKDWKLKKV